MKCYAVDCLDKVVAYSIVDDGLACEAHVVGDYFRPLEEEPNE